MSVPPQVYLIEDLATGGELFDRVVELGYFSEKDASQYIKQIVLAIEYLHNMGELQQNTEPQPPMKC